MDHKNASNRTKAFSETEITDDLKRFDILVLILHGDVDRVAPVTASARLLAKLVKASNLEV
jgi:non-heme chloroperoxidase